MKSSSGSRDTTVRTSNAMCRHQDDCIQESSRHTMVTKGLMVLRRVQYEYGTVRKTNILRVPVRVPYSYEYCFAYT